MINAALDTVSCKISSCFANNGHATDAPPSSVMNSQRSFDHLVGKRREEEEDWGR
jgi:hypothetical protein